MLHNDTALVKYGMLTSACLPKMHVKLPQSHTNICPILGSHVDGISGGWPGNLGLASGRAVAAKPTACH